MINFVTDILFFRRRDGEKNEVFLGEDLSLG